MRALVRGRPERSALTLPACDRLVNGVRPPYCHTTDDSAKAALQLAAVLTNGAQCLLGKFRSGGGFSHGYLAAPKLLQIINKIIGEPHKIEPP